MTAAAADAALKLRVRAEALDAAAGIARREGRTPGHADRLRKAADELRRQAFRIEETGR